MPFETTVWSVLDAARRSSEQAAHEIVIRYRPPIIDYVCRQGLGFADAEDVAQDVLVEICRPDFLASADRRKGRFRSLILAVVRHKLASHRRRETALKRGGGAPWISLYEDDSGDHTVEGRVAGDQDPPDVEFDRLWTLNLVRRAIERLKDDAPHLAQAVSLFYEEEASYEQIAQRMGKSVHDVTNYLHEARRRIRKLVRQGIEEYVSSFEEYQDELGQLLKHL